MAIYYIGSAKYDKSDNDLIGYDGVYYHYSEDNMKLGIVKLVNITIEKVLLESTDWFCKEENEEEETVNIEKMFKTDLTKLYDLILEKCNNVYQVYITISISSTDIATHSNLKFDFNTIKEEDNKNPILCLKINKQENYYRIDLIDMKTGYGNYLKMGKLNEN